MKVRRASNSFSDKCGGLLLSNKLLASFNSNFLELLLFRGPPMPCRHTELELEPYPARDLPGKGFNGAVYLFIFDEVF